MKTIIIGDVHGCYEELCKLLEKTKYSPGNDRLIFVGDLINKGPYSLKVLEFVKESNAEFVIGNHEAAFIRSVNEVQSQIKPDIQNLIDSLDDAEKWAQWLAKFPLYIEDKDFIVVHAGLEPNKKLKEQNQKVLTTIRTWDGIGDDLNNESDLPWWKLYNAKKLVVYGHWAAAGLNVQENTIGLDSRCLYGGHLSALVLPERKVIQVQAERVYREFNCD